MGLQVLVQQGGVFHIHPQFGKGPAGPVQKPELAIIESAPGDVGKGKAGGPAPGGGIGQVTALHHQAVVVIGQKEVEGQKIEQGEEAAAEKGCGKFHKEEGQDGAAAEEEKTEPAHDEGKFVLAEGEGVGKGGGLCLCGGWVGTGTPPGSMKGISWAKRYWPKRRAFWRLQAKRASSRFSLS